MENNKLLKSGEFLVKEVDSKDILFLRNSMRNNE